MSRSSGPSPPSPAPPHQTVRRVFPNTAFRRPSPYAYQHPLPVMYSGLPNWHTSSRQTSCPGPSIGPSMDHRTSASGNSTVELPIRRLFRCTRQFALQNSNSLRMFIAFRHSCNPSPQNKHDRSRAPRSRRVMLSHPSSLTGPSEFPPSITQILPVSSNLIQAYHRWSMVETVGLQVRFSVLCLRMPPALPRVPCRCICPLPSLQALAFPLNVEGRRVSRSSRVYPTTGLSQQCPSGVTSRGCTVRFMLRPADLAGTPGWAKTRIVFIRAVRGTVSRQVRPVCYHTNPPSAYTPKRAIGVTTSFHVARERNRDLVHVSTTCAGA